ncbi:RHS repeat-associated core domain-containing protein [Acinetobacter pittii]|nr:RHS repeat-associated core domain-containing protein [Acinetobacter pittii]
MPLLQAAYHHPIELHQTQDWTEKTYSIYKDPLWNTVKQSQGFDDIWFYHCDHLGTPQEMSNQTGAIIWKAQYKAWGECKVEQGKSDFFDNSEIISNNIRFQGQYFDGETGLHYNRYRYYSPYVGRFISKDPIELLGGFNMYSYAPNPVVWIDPFGLTCKSWLAKALDAGHTIPSDMTRPHGHHIVFKGKFEKTAYAPYVNKSKSILKKYGIDPVNDPANLMIANNGQGVHTVENAKKVSVELTKADREISSAVKCEQITVAQSKVLMRAELQIIGQKFLEVIDNGFVA